MFIPVWCDLRRHRLWVYSQTMFNQLKAQNLEKDRFDKLRTRVIAVERNMAQGRSSITITVATPPILMYHLAKQDVLNGLLEMARKDGRLGRLHDKLYDTREGKLYPKEFLTLVDYMMACLIFQDMSPHVSVYEDIRVDVMDHNATKRIVTLGLRQLIPLAVEYGIHEIMKPYFDVMMALFRGDVYELKNGDGQVVWREEPIKILTSDFVKTYPFNDYARRRIEEELKKQLPETTTRVRRTNKPRRPRAPASNGAPSKRRRTNEHVFPVMALETSQPQPVLSIPTTSTQAPTSTTTTTSTDRGVFASLADVEFDSKSFAHLLESESTDNFDGCSQFHLRKVRALTFVPPSFVPVIPPLPCLPNDTPPQPTAEATTQPSSSMEVDSAQPDPIIDRLYDSIAS